MTRDDETRLHAYLDGELGATESIDLERRLASDAELRAGLEELRAISARIRRQASYHDAPPGLAGRILGRVRRQAPRARAAFWGPLAAGAALAAAVAWIAPGMLRLQADGWNRQADQVLEDHLRANFSAHWIDVASSDRHTVKPWLSAHLGFSPSVPDLSDQGFELLGGRVDVLDGRPVAALVYRRRQHMISVFAVPGEAAAGTASSERRGYHVVRWPAAGFVYWAVSDLNEAELREFARLVSSAP